MQVGINLLHFLRHLLTTFESLTGDVSRHAKTILINYAGDGKKVFMWNEHKLFFQTITKIENTDTCTISYHVTTVVTW